MQNPINRFITFLSITVLFTFIGIFVATQQVAYHCEYDSALGQGFQITNNIVLYKPWMFIIWYIHASDIIPTIIHNAENSIYICILLGMSISLFIIRRKSPNTSHGSATWGGKRDIKKAHLKAKEGVILGINPFTYTKNLIYKQTYLLQYDINEKSHTLLVAPTRTGKGVGVIIPTLLTWKESVFVLDIKDGENWDYTASFRRKGLKQKVLNFNPLDTKGITARWNPIAEVQYRTDREYADVMTIANMIADPTGKMANDPKSKHWVLTASALIEAVIMHLLYVHDKEHKPVPNMGDVTRFISSSSRSFDEAITEMMYYQHITPEEAFSDDNIFQKIYGDYVEINAFNDSFLETEETDSLKLRKIRSDILNISEDDLDKNSYYNDYSKFLNFSEIKAYFKDDYQNLDFEMKPYCFLLTHPRVASGAYKMASRAEEEQSSVLSTAATGFQLYQDPVISKNTAVSDFKLDDVMNYEKAVSLYLVASSADRAILQPIFRLMLDFFLRRNMKNLTERKKHKCLLLLDEFPQIGKIDQFEMAIATMAGYQLRSLIIIQNLSQLYSIYGKDTSIISNCAVRVFYTPNDDNTPKVISNMLGKETITVTSKSETNNLLKKNKSWQSAARDLMTVDEVLNLPESQEIVFINGKRPILAKKLLYYKIPFFLNRVSIWQKEDNNVLNPKYPPLLKSDYCTIVDSYTKLLPKAVEKGKLNSLSNNITLKKNTKKINSKLSVISLYILTIKNKIKTLLAKKKQQPEKISQPNFVVKDSINELQKPKTKTSITSTSAEEVPVTAIEDIQQIEELEPIQNESEDNMNMLETKTDEQIPGMGDLITKQNTTKTTENEATFTDTFEDDDINQAKDNYTETVNNNNDETKNTEIEHAKSDEESETKEINSKAEDNKTNQVNVVTEQIPTETSTNESKPVAKSEKTIIQRKLIKRKSPSEVDMKMLSYLHNLGIANIEELNFYLDNCTLSIDEIQEKIARYQQELDELAAIYDELEAS